ncbi:hypothetical protein ACFL2U_00505 [Patescibacteria group bacterium]
MIRMICACCKKVLGYVESEYTADSGDICPRCCRVEYPDFYQSQKEQGMFTPEQIREAESDAIIVRDTDFVMIPKPE